MDLNSECRRKVKLYLNNYLCFNFLGYPFRYAEVMTRCKVAMITFGTWLIPMSVIITQLVPFTLLNFEYLNCEIVTDGKLPIKHLIQYLQSLQILTTFRL